MGELSCGEGGGGQNPRAKPQAAAGVPKIADFGLAKLLQEGPAGPTQTGDVPEQTNFWYRRANRVPRCRGPRGLSRCLRRDAQALRRQAPSRRDLPLCVRGRSQGRRRPESAGHVVPGGGGRGASCPGKIPAGKVAFGGCPRVQWTSPPAYRGAF